MSGNENFWDQAVSANPRSSWPALVVNLVGWSTLYGLNLVLVLDGYLASSYAVIGLVGFLIPIGHCLTSMIRKLRGYPG